eukprot:1964047-Pyramimonas_sp.AAC.1
MPRCMGTTARLASIAFHVAQHKGGSHGCASKALRCAREARLRITLPRAALDRVLSALLSQPLQQMAASVQG